MEDTRLRLPAAQSLWQASMLMVRLLIIEVGSFRTFDIEGKVSFDAAARLTNGEFGTIATFTAVPVAAPRPAVPPALRHSVISIPYDLSNSSLLAEGAIIFEQVCKPGFDLKGGVYWFPRNPAREAATVAVADAALHCCNSLTCRSAVSRRPARSHLG